MKLKRALTIILITDLILLIACLVLFELMNISLAKDKLLDGIIKGIIFRGACAIALIVLAIYCGYNYMGFKGLRLKNLLIIAPCLLICINNFPFIDYFMGNLYINRYDLITAFALECVFVGLFEELLFRGLVLTICLERWRKSKHGELLAILISSAAFGLFHLLNLFSGSSVGAVLMQIGYSFLLGCMLSFTLLKTKCVWLCVFFHALYNFGGLFFITLGGGIFWSVFTIILTATVAVLVGGYLIFAYFKFSKSYKSDIIGKNNQPELKADNGHFKE